MAGEIGGWVRARQGWPGHPVSLKRAHEVLLPFRDSYGFCFHMKPCEGGVADVGLPAINNFHL